MNIPNLIINAIENTPLSVRGQVYCAVINFMCTDADPDFTLSDDALAFYRVIKAVLVPVIERRRRDAERRRRRREALQASHEAPASTQQTSPDTVPDPVPAPEPPAAVPDAAPDDIIFHPEISPIILDAHTLYFDPAVRHRHILRMLAGRFPDFVLEGYLPDGRLKGHFAAGA